jgi:hypothetical protein
MNQLSRILTQVIDNKMSAIRLLNSRLREIGNILQNAGGWESELFDEYGVSDKIRILIVNFYYDSMERSSEIEKFWALREIINFVEVIEKNLKK